jgi:FAS-associated factor 2
MTVSNSLTCTRFPFVALIANIPSPTPSSPAQMTLLTRIEGPISATRLIATLTTSVSRTKSILIQRRAIKADQNFTRQLRKQQEEAYTNSLAQDRLREETERRRIAEIQQLERQRQEKEKEMERRKRNREQWRLWKAGELRKGGIVGMKNEIGKTARVGLRLINGERIVQPIPGDFTLEEVYSFVECYDLLFPPQQREEGKSGVTLRSSREEGGIGEEMSVEKPEDYEHEFMFRLVVPYPRKVIDSGLTLVKNEGGLWPSGSIVVEEIEEEEDEEEDEEEEEEDSEEED